MFCNHCGKEMPNVSEICPYCGQTQGVAVNDRYADSKYKTPSSWSYAFLLILLHIPFIGFLFALVVALFAHKVNIKNMARARIVVWILTVIGLLLGINALTGYFAEDYDLPKGAINSFRPITMTVKSWLPKGKASKTLETPSCYTFTEDSLMDLIMDTVDAEYDMVSEEGETLVSMIKDATDFESGLLDVLTKVELVATKALYKYALMAMDIDLLKEELYVPEITIEFTSEGNAAIYVNNKVEDCSYTLDGTQLEFDDDTMWYLDDPEISFSPDFRCMTLSYDYDYYDFPAVKLYRTK